MNPLSGELMKAYRAYCALTGLDDGCKAYIEAYANTAAAPDVPAGGAAQKCDTTVHLRRQRTRPQMRLGAAPLFAKNTPYPVSGAPEKENVKINRKRFFARIRQTARSKAARRENAPVPQSGPHAPDCCARRRTAFRPY